MQLRSNVDIALLGFGFSYLKERMVGLRRAVVLVSWGKILVVVEYGLCCVGGQIRQT